MNGFAEYLSIFSCREASSVVQSQLAKHRKLEPRPHSVLYKAHVPQKIWVVCQAAGDWRPFSVREPRDHRVYCPVLGLDEADDRD